MLHCRSQIPQTEAEWRDVAVDFWQQWNFPNCMGAMDGKHVQPLPGSGSTYFRTKKFNNIVLLALVDAHYKFLYADIGSFGGISDGGIYNSLSLAAAIKSGQQDSRLPT